MRGGVVQLFAGDRGPAMAKSTWPMLVVGKTWRWVWGTS